MGKIKAETKLKVAIILLIVGLIFIPIVSISIMTLILLPIPVILIPLGLIIFYRGLSIQNRGIMLLIIGGIFITWSTLVINGALRLYREPILALSTINIIFWVLCFIVPGVIKIAKKIEFDEKTTYLYILAPLTTLWVLIYTIIIAGIASSAPITFASLYSQYFIIAVGCGFLLSSIIIGFSYLEYH